MLTTSPCAEPASTRSIASLGGKPAETGAARRASPVPSSACSVSVERALRASISVVTRSSV